jgi:hypothetical protein
MIAVLHFVLSAAYVCAVAPLVVLIVLNRSLALRMRLAVGCLALAVLELSLSLIERDSFDIAMDLLKAAAAFGIVVATRQAKRLASGERAS